MRPVLYLRNDPADSVGIVPDAVRGKVALRVVDAWREDGSWPETDELGGLVVGGGQMNADETASYPFLLRVRGLLRRAVDAGLPVLGICLGAQLLARALDARVYPAPVKEVGFSPVRLTSEGVRDPLLSAYGRNARVFHWHEDTFDPPPGATLLATGARVRMQAYRIGPRAWGVQFHPEVERAELEAWMAQAGDRLEAAWGVSPSALREGIAAHLPEHERRGRRLFRRFAELAAETTGDRRE